VGRVAVVPDHVEPGIINPRLVRYRPDFALVRPQFLKLAIMNPAARAQLFETAKGTTMEGLNMQILGRLVLGLPPLVEQDRILATVDAETRELRSASDAASRSVSLLREYRTRLIADVVTGKLDVREAAARLPDEADEPEPLDEAEDLSDTDEATPDDLDTASEEAEA